MKCKIIDGVAISQQIRKELSEKVATFTKKHFQPRLAVVLVGDNPASLIYVRKKREACEEVGIATSVINPINEIKRNNCLPQVILEEEISKLNRNTSIHGILVQLPLPKDFDVYRIFDLINPKKDVDVFNPINVGMLVQGRSRFLPCTPHAVQQMLSRSGSSVAGKHVVVINRSDVVGKPLSSMLIQDNDEFANATVTVCHDRTPKESLKRITKSADIVVVAVGKPNFLKSDMIHSDTVIIDVGINRVGDKIVGDVDKSCFDVASAISRVPGGVGPLTVTCLLENTLKAAEIMAHDLERDIR